MKPRKMARCPESQRLPTGDNAKNAVPSSANPLPDVVTGSDRSRLMSSRFEVKTWEAVAGLKKRETAVASAGRLLLLADQAAKLRPVAAKAGDAFNTR